MRVNQKQASQERELVRSALARSEPTRSKQVRFKGQPEASQPGVNTVRF